MIRNLKLDPKTKRFFIEETILPENPKHSDTIVFTNRRGQTYRKTYIVCPECGNGSWRFTTNVNKPNFSGLCGACKTKKFGLLCGKNNPNWKGGRSKTAGGYVRVWISYDSPFYPMTRKVSKGRLGGYLLEHRLVMAQHLGRCLEPWEIVHHKNAIITDNRLENLELVETQKKHAMMPYDELQNLRTRVTQLEAEVALLTAQLEKDGIQY